MAKVNLNEILHPKMDVLFVALNPPEQSNNNGHYFSGSMAFWNILYNSGLITEAVSCPINGDAEIFSGNAKNYLKATYGVTDLCHDVVETKSSLVRIHKERISRINNILTTKQVNNLCLMHSKVSRAFRNEKGIDKKLPYGFIGKMGNTNVYRVHFPNAGIFNETKEKYYSQIKSTMNGAKNRK